MSSGNRCVFRQSFPKSLLLVELQDSGKVFPIHLENVKERFKFREVIRTISLVIEATTIGVP